MATPQSATAMSNRHISRENNCGPRFKGKKRGQTRRQGKKVRERTRTEATWPRALLRRHSFILPSIPAFFQILLSNLTTNLWHELKVQGATRSIYNQSLVYRGDFSESQKILLRLNCDEVHASTVVRTEDIGLELSAGMIAGGACVGFALILAVLAVALWRKYFNESYYYLDESPSTPVIVDFIFNES